MRNCRPNDILKSLHVARMTRKSVPSAKLPAGHPYRTNVPFFGPPTRSPIRSKFHSYIPNSFHRTIPVSPDSDHTMTTSSPSPDRKRNFHMPTSPPPLSRVNLSSTFHRSFLLSSESSWAGDSDSETLLVEPNPYCQSAEKNEVSSRPVATEDQSSPTNGAQKSHGTKSLTSAPALTHHLVP